MTIRCFVVDDEPLARRGVEAELARHVDFRLELSSGDPMAALEAVIERRPDLLFLDVAMPDLDGMTFLERMRQRLPSEERPYVVLVTAFDRYALLAFQYEALDYLVKPFDSERFAETLRRAAQRLRTRRSAPNTPERSSPTRLRFDVSQGVAFIDPFELCWVESADHYLLLHVEARTHLVRETMANMEALLEPHGFVRVHRGALLHPRHVSAIETLGDGGRCLTLTEGSRVRVSRRRWPQLRERLDAR